MNSPAWKNQCFAPDKIPSAIPESEYVAPTTSITSNDNRKNWTDCQETAQWLGGLEIPTRLLESLGLGGSTGQFRTNFFECVSVNVQF